MINRKNIILWLFSCTACLQAADKPTVVWLDAAVEDAPASMLQDKPAELSLLLYSVTGQDKKPETLSHWQVLTQATQMHVEENAVMIPLKVYPSHDHNASLPIIPRYWPYAWFVDASDGNTTEILLNGGRIVARLFLTSMPGSAIPFHIEAAKKVAQCLLCKDVVSPTEIAQAIGMRYEGIEIEGL